MELGAGPPDAPAIVFIHGIRLTGAVWGPQLRALSDEFRVIAVDLPGHGRSAGEPFTLAGAADAVAATIDAEANGRAIVVGLSLGGYVSMELAARFPDRVRGLVIAGASAEPSGFGRRPFLALAWAMRSVSGSRQDALNRWFFRTRFPAAIADPIVEGGFWSSAGSEALRALAGERFTPRRAAYPGPTLILNGQWDVPFRVSEHRFVAAAANPRRVHLKGATHLSNLDRPAAFTAAVRDFARSLDGP